MVARVLTIAGSDPSGGAGIQADLKTYAAFGVYGMTTITALTVQNTQGVSRVVMSAPDVVQEQIETVLEDIGVDAIKIGMLGNADVVHAVSGTLSKISGIPIVVDPVMRAKGGDPLLDTEGEAAFRDEILPLATILTPNLPEASALVGFPVVDRMAMAKAASAIANMGVPTVLVKGGHLVDDEAADLLWHAGLETWLSHRRIATDHTHGTGCTLSSAIAAGLALGDDMGQAVLKAKDYVTRAIIAAPQLGQGHGPLWHGVQ